MEQEDNKGFVNPPEVPSSPKSSEKDNCKKDAIPPEPEVEGSSKTEHEESCKPALERSSKSEPEGSNIPKTEVSGKPEPEGSIIPEPKGSSIPGPEGSNKHEPSDKNTPQQLKGKSKILKKSKAGKVKISGSRKIIDKNRNVEQEDIKGDENPLQVPSGPQSLEKDNCQKDASPLEGSCKPQAEGSNKPEPEESSKLEPSDKNTPKSLKAKSKVLKKSKAGKVKINGSQQFCGKLRNIEQEDGKGFENPSEVPPNPHCLEKDISKKDANIGQDGKGSENPPEVPSSTQSLEKGHSKKDAIPPEGSSKRQPEGSSKRHPEGSSKPELEGSSKPEPSDKNTPQSLKAKSKILKKFKADKVTVNGSKQIRRRKRNRKNKKVMGNIEEKRLEVEKGKGKEVQNKGTIDKSPIERRLLANKNKMVEFDKSERKQKNKDKHRESDKGGRGRTNKAKQSGSEHTETSERKREKLGGFIFMCSGKTKPDCFRYRVMGVMATKKDVVLGVKPGMKLFLYDFDLKLLYGIYKASSSGGMKLEPRAFGGNFPAQVRFDVARDCFPLPESIFKKAIKENYNEKNKFKTELTVRQVRKLTELFRPVEIRSALPPVSPPRAIIQEEEDPDVRKSSWSHFHRERAAGVRYAKSDVDTYNMLSHERDPRIEREEEISRNLFLTEKSYRAYGLPGDRGSVASASQVHPVLEPYQRDYEREHRHHLDPIYRGSVRAHIGSLHASPRHLNESEHRTYFCGAIADYKEDPYHVYRYGALPRDPYLPPLRREDLSLSSYAVGGRTLIGTDKLQRRETVPDRHYSTYSAADALSEYDQVQQYHREKADATTAPVSSRYSFAAGPSYSLR